MKTLVVSTLLPFNFIIYIISFLSCCKISLLLLTLKQTLLQSWTTGIMGNGLQLFAWIPVLLQTPSTMRNASIPLNPHGPEWRNARACFHEDRVLTSSGALALITVKCSFPQLFYYSFLPYDIHMYYKSISLKNHLQIQIKQTFQNSLNLYN